MEQLALNQAQGFTVLNDKLPKPIEEHRIFESLTEKSGTWIT
jgi:hypothetical protein